MSRAYTDKGVLSIMAKPGAWGMLFKSAYTVTVCGAPGARTSGVVRLTSIEEVSEAMTSVSTNFCVPARSVSFLMTPFGTRATPLVSTKSNCRSLSSTSAVFTAPSLVSSTSKTARFS